MTWVNFRLLLIKIELDNKKQTQKLKHLLLPLFPSPPILSHPQLHSEVLFFLLPLL